MFFYVLFTVSEKINSRKIQSEKKGLEQFNVVYQPEVTDESCHARPGCILVAVRDYNNMAHLHTVIEKTNLRRHDIVVMTVQEITTGAGPFKLAENQLFSNYEKELFSHVVTMAEKHGKTVTYWWRLESTPFTRWLRRPPN